MEAQALADSLQRSRDRIRAELFAAPGGDDRLAGLQPRSAVMSFLLAPQRRGLMLSALTTMLSFASRSRRADTAGFPGLRGVVLPLLALWLGRR